MPRGFVIYVVLLVFPLFLYSCGGEEPEDIIPPKKTPPAAVEKTEEEEKPIVLVASTIKTRMRNPFLSPFTVDEVVNPLPLQCCDIMTFKVLAVLVGLDGATALVRSTDGKNYYVKEGDAIGLRHGKVVEILRGTIVVEEYEKDYEGTIISTDIVELGVPVDKRN